MSVDALTVSPATQPQRPSPFSDNIASLREPTLSRFEDVDLGRVRGRSQQQHEQSSLAAAASCAAPAARPSAAAPQASATSTRIGQAARELAEHRDRAHQWELKAQQVQRDLAATLARVTDESVGGSSSDGVQALHLAVSELVPSGESPPVAQSNARAESKAVSVVRETLLTTEAPLARDGRCQPEQHARMPRQAVQSADDSQCPVDVVRRDLGREFTERPVQAEQVKLANASSDTLRRSSSGKILVQRHSPVGDSNDTDSNGYFDAGAGLDVRTLYEMERRKCSSSEDARRRVALQLAELTDQLQLETANHTDCIENAQALAQTAKRRALEDLDKVRKQADTLHSADAVWEEALERTDFEMVCAKEAHGSALEEHAGTAGRLRESETADAELRAALAFTHVESREAQRSLKMQEVAWEAERSQLLSELERLRAELDEARCSRDRVKGLQLSSSSHRAIQEAELRGKLDAGQLHVRATRDVVSKRCDALQKQIASHAAAHDEIRDRLANVVDSNAQLQLTAEDEGDRLREELEIERAAATARHKDNAKLRYSLERENARLAAQASELASRCTALSSLQADLHERAETLGLGRTGVRAV